MGASEFNARGNPAMDYCSIPSGGGGGGGGGRNTPSRFMLRKPDKPRPDGPLDSYSYLTFNSRVTESN